MGVDIEALLHRCQVAEQMCAHYDSSESNSGLWLGAAIGELARQGRDKLTFVISPPIESFGLWVEQLVAESTGKQGAGSCRSPTSRSATPRRLRRRPRVRLPAQRRASPTSDLDAAIEAARRRPAIRRSRSPAHGPADLGRIFFLTEFAVAVAGWALEINPFDQPNVQEAKDNTGARARLAAEPPVAATVAGDDELRALLADAAAAALRGDPGLPAAVRRARRGGRRAAQRDPRRHQGGDHVRLRPALPALDRPAAQGRPADRALPAARRTTPSETPTIPGAGYSFGTLIAAQAAGDLETLRAHGLPAERVELEGDPAAAVRALTERIKAILRRAEPMQSAAVATEVEQDNPLDRGPRAAAGPPDRAGDLRRDRRPRPPQAAAGALQPRPRGGAARALRADRRRRAAT